MRVTPRGGRDGVDGLMTDANGRVMLKIRVSAAPSDGAANKAVAVLLAKALGAPKSAVEVVSGHTARVKQIRIAGDPDSLRRRLKEILGDA